MLVGHRGVQRPEQAQEPLSRPPEGVRPLPTGEVTDRGPRPEKRPSLTHQDSATSRPGIDRQKRALAVFLGTLIVLLLLFLLSVAILRMLRRNIGPPPDGAKRTPTDSLDLWSLAGQEEARRRAGKKPPRQPKDTTEDDPS